MQFKREEEVTIELNMTKYVAAGAALRSITLTGCRELLEEKYKGKLNARYEQPQHQVVAQVFRGLSGKRIVTPSKDFVRYEGNPRCGITKLTLAAITNNQVLNAALKQTKGTFSA